MNDSERPDTVADRCVRELHANGIDCVFGLVGSHTLPIYAALQRFGKIRHVSCKHEFTAVLAAENYARMTGRIGCAVTTAGPGALNGFSGMGQAELLATPLLVLAGGVPVDAPLYDVHGIGALDYTARAAAAVVKWSARPGTPADVLPALRSGIRRAQTGRPGPVYIEIPLDVQAMPAAASGDAVAVPLAAMADEALHAVARAITRGNVLICVDRAALSLNMGSAVLNLAEHCNAGIAVTREAMHLLPADHPRLRGVINDFHFPRDAFRAIAAADAILTLGFVKGSRNHRWVLDAARAQTLSLDFAADRQGGELDLPNALGRLTSLLSANKPLRPHNPVNRSVPAVPLWEAAAGTVDFRTVLRALNAHIDERTTIVHDVGNHEVWSRWLLPAMGAGGGFGCGNWAGMGNAVAGLIAACVADPNARPLGITGDGCLLMSLGDLVTLAELGRPVVLVVLNDAEYGMISNVQRGRGQTPFATAIAPVDFAALAQAAGWQGLVIESPASIRRTLATAFAASHPVLIDVRCPPLREYPKFESDD